MAINFPDSPVTGQTFTASNRTWTYNGSSWVGDYSSTGNADTLDGIDSSQFLRSDANDITTGTITSTNATGLIVNSGLTYSRIDLSSINNTFYLQTEDSAFDGMGMYDAVNSAWRLVALTNGRIGIGTTNPSYTLHVNGTGNFNDTLNFSLGSVGIISWGSMGGGTGFGIQAGASRTLSLGSGGSWDRLIIDSVGNVGINTTSIANNERFVVNATEGIYHFAMRDGATLIGGIHANGDILTIDDANNNGILLAATSTKVQGNLDIDVDVANQGSAEDYTSSTFKKLKFGNNHATSARGPNKIIMHDSGAGWVGGFGIHSDTTSYYTGGWHRFYKTTAVPSTNTTVFEIGSNGFVPPKLSSDPGSPVTGQTYFNTTSNVLRIYNGSIWMNVYDSPVGLTSGNPVTSTTSFTGTAGNIYYIQPGGIGAVVQAEYSGDNFKGTGYGYFKYWSAPDLGAPTVSLYGQGLRWNIFLIEKAGGVWQWLGFSGTYLTFDARSDTTAIGTFGTRAGYRVFFGFAGGHGIYNTGQSVCNWGSSGSAIGAGWDGSTCGSFPSGLRMGVGQDGTPVYTDRGGTWNFWFSF